MAGVRSINLCSMIETLEDRQLLSAAPVSLRGGNLMVHGTRGNDTVQFVAVVTQVSQDTQTQQDAQAPADTQTPAADSVTQLKVIFNGQEKTFDMAKVRRIFVNAGQGNDTISFDESAGALTYGYSQLIGGPGDDVITGGSGNDRIFGNQGNDSLAGGGGSDWIDGDQGDDDLAGNDGQDTLVGDSGNDDFVGTDGSREIKDKGATDNGDNVLGVKKHTRRVRVHA